MSHVYAMTDEPMLKQYCVAEVDQGLKRRWSEHLLREARPFINVDMQFDNANLAWVATCTVGGPGEFAYKSQVRINDGASENGLANQHPEWMRYHAETMVRLADTGVFLKWFERTLPAEQRAFFNKLYNEIKCVNLVPSDPHHNQVDDTYLACLVFNGCRGTFRETVGNIRRDPQAFLAMLTMVQR